MNVVNKRANDYQLIATSWHEASHTICALFNFIRVEHVCVDPSDKEELGTMQYEMFDARVKNKQLAKLLIICEVQLLYAGLVGERLYYQEICGSEKFPMHLRIGSSNDIQAAAELISRHNLSPSGKERFAFKRKVQKDVEKVLINQWDDLRILAHSLYRSKQLSYQELKSLLTRKSTSKNFWQARFKHIEFLSKEDTAIEEKYLKLIFPTLVNISGVTG